MLEAVKNLNLDTFSLLWNEILTSSKHCLCIICVYSEVLIPALSLFVIRVNYHCKNSFCCCGFRKTCAIKHNPFHIFCCVLSYIYHALYFLISMSWFIQLIDLLFLKLQSYKFNIFRHMFATSYEFYYSTTEPAPCYLASTFQQVRGTIATAAGSPQQ